MCEGFFILNIKIYNDNELWDELVQSAYTELFFVLEIEHTLWHLLSSHIIFSAQKSLFPSEIYNIFKCNSLTCYTYNKFINFSLKIFFSTKQ